MNPTNGQRHVDDRDRRRARASNPDSTMPATFAGADTSRMSSIDAGREDDERRAARRRARWPATRTSSRTAASSDARRRRPATMPRNIAPPPSVGVGRACTLRSPGAAIAPRRPARRIISGTIAAVTDRGDRQDDHVRAEHGSHPSERSTSRRGRRSASGAVRLGYGTNSAHKARPPRDRTAATTVGIVRGRGAPGR